MDVRRELFASSLTPVIDWPCNIWPYDVIPISKPVHLFDLIVSDETSLTRKTTKTLTLIIVTQNGRICTARWTTVQRFSLITLLPSHH